jgi:hypothetical protein
MAIALSDVRYWGQSGHCPKLLARDEARGGLQRISPSCRSCCGGHRHLKPVSATTRAEKRDLASVHNTTRGASYALVHACAVRSCRADRDSCALCSVPSRSLSDSGCSPQLSRARRCRHGGMTIILVWMQYSHESPHDDGFKNPIGMRTTAALQLDPEPHFVGRKSAVITNTRRGPKP